jgi:hypothetical protein
MHSRYYQDSPARDEAVDGRNFSRYSLDRAMYDIYSLVSNTFRSRDRIIDEVSQEYGIPAYILRHVYNVEVSEMIDHGAI